MSTFENTQFRWRETYFVLLLGQDRPTIMQMEHALAELNDRFELVNITGNDDGQFESVTLKSPDDYAALDICYLSGEEVVEQGVALADELKATASKDELDIIRKIPDYDARIDVLHFQDVAAVTGEGDDDELGEMFDPSALLVVIEALVQLTSGVAIDPQSGTLY